MGSNTTHQATTETFQYQTHTTASVATKQKSQTEYYTSWALEATSGQSTQTQANEVWYTSTNKLIGEAGSDTPYGVWPLWVFSGGSIAGGVYFLNVGHEYSPPLFRGAKQLAINITDGSLSMGNTQALT